jgi:glycosyltransferase involved in cell wall biosynthesis
MRVLFITGEYPIMQGGVGDYTRQLSQALGARRVDVHVLTDANAGGDHLRRPAGAYEPTVHPIIDQEGWALWGFVLQLCRRLRLKVQPNRPRLVTTFHDLRFPYLFPKAGPLRWRAVLALAQGSDASVITNPIDWLRLARAGLSGRMFPIPIGSNIYCQPPADYDRARQRAQWGAGPDTWLLAYFGFMNAGKGGETLIRALADLAQAGKPARLLMVGGQVGASDPTNQAYLARIEQLIDELGVRERVQWTGFTSSDQVSANLLAADCAVLPYREGASLRHGSLMAALAHGLPIVSTRPPDDVREVAGLFPVLHNAKSALLVSPDDPAGLAEAVVRLMSDGVLRAQLAQAAKELSHQFEWNAIAERHVEMYQRLGVST